MDCIDCIEIAARLHLYIDRELSAEEITMVQQHLASCPQCECRFHVDISIKRLIHERCTLQKAPARLREAVMQLARQAQNAPLELDYATEMELKADINYYE